MLIKLASHDVTRLWGELKRTAVAAVPPHVSSLEEHTNAVLAAILRGDLDCWILTKGDDPEKLAKGVAFVGTVIDSFSMTKNLLIYGIFSYERVSMELWKEGLATLRAEAERKGCNLIIGYTSEPRILEIVNALGGSTNTTLITLEV